MNNTNSIFLCTFNIVKIKYFDHCFHVISEILSITASKHMHALTQ